MNISFKICKNIPLHLFISNKKFFYIVGLSTILLLLATSAFAQETIEPTQDTHLLSILLNRFQTESDKWEPLIQGYSLALFKYLLIIDIVWKGIRLGIKRAPVEEIISELLLFVLFSTIMLVTIFHYKEWSNSIMALFSHIAQDAGAPEATPTAIFKAGMKILGKIWAEASVWSPITGTVYALCAIALIITFSLIAAQMMLVKCESFIVLNAGAILLGLGGAQITREYAINFLRYALSVALKLFVMQLLVSLSITFINEFVALNAKNVQEIFVVLGASVIILALTMSIPDIVSGIVNGSHVSTGNAMASAVTAVSTATLAAGRGFSGGLGGAVGAKRSMDSLKEACSFADSAGKSGMGKIGHVAGTGMRALRDNLSQGRSAGVRSSVKAQHEAFKMEQADSGPSNDWWHP
ncbi:P-type conjugative transfer protein TrbL [Maridesulfovibrio sp.]|uniref:P-type conjugative transfer protein TrbL n=1 Tax=Maridesulfovibrio sp. TaxID=2795000 RepID=UPI0029CAA65C|nr:P-type conjugative transfer protein TrbL [Maridesulfovibrio sp.]